MGLLVGVTRYPTTNLGANVKVLLPRLFMIVWFATLLHYFYQCRAGLNPILSRTILLSIDRFIGK
jgi:hypothetical protein